MLGHVLIGLLVGLVAGGAALVLGKPIWLAALLYVLGVNLSLAVGALVAWQRERAARRRAEREQQTAQAKGSGRPIRPGH